MILLEIAKRTGIPLRGLRYVVDRGIVDRRRFTGRDRLNTRRGSPRFFSDFGGFCVALAALLREAGLSQKRVRAVMNFIFAWATSTLLPRSRPTMEAFLAFRLARRIRVEIGDTVNVRIVVRSSGKRDVSVPESTGWTNIETSRELRAPYVPLIRTEIAVAELARRLTD